MLAVNHALSAFQLGRSRRPSPSSGSWSQSGLDLPAQEEFPHPFVSPLRGRQTDQRSGAESSLLRFPRGGLCLNPVGPGTAPRLGPSAHPWVLASESLPPRLASLPSNPASPLVEFLLLQLKISTCQPCSAHVLVPLGQFSQCGLQTSRALRCFQGDLWSQNRVQTNAKTLFFFTMLAFALMVQKPRWMKLLAT